MSTSGPQDKGKDRKDDGASSSAGGPPPPPPSSGAPPPPPPMGIVLSGEFLAKQKELEQEMVRIAKIPDPKVQRTEQNRLNAHALNEFSVSAGEFDCREVASWNPKNHTPNYTPAKRVKGDIASFIAQTLALLPYLQLAELDEYGKYNTVIDRLESGRVTNKDLVDLNAAAIVEEDRLKKLVDDISARINNFTELHQTAITDIDKGIADNNRLLDEGNFLDAQEQADIEADLRALDEKRRYLEENLALNLEPLTEGLTDSLERLKAVAQLKEKISGARKPFLEVAKAAPRKISTGQKAKQSNDDNAVQLARADFDDNIWETTIFVGYRLENARRFVTLETELGEHLSDEEVFSRLKKMANPVGMAKHEPVGAIALIAIASGHLRQNKEGGVNLMNPLGGSLSVDKSKERRRDALYQRLIDQNPKYEIKPMANVGASASADASVMPSLDDILQANRDVSQVGSGPRPSDVGVPVEAMSSSSHMGELRTRVRDRAKAEASDSPLPAQGLANRRDGAEIHEAIQRYRDERELEGGGRVLTEEDLRPRNQAALDAGQKQVAKALTEDPQNPLEAALQHAILSSILKGEFVSEDLKAMAKERLVIIAESQQAVIHEQAQRIEVLETPANILSRIQSAGDVEGALAEALRTFQIKNERDPTLLDVNKMKRSLDRNQQRLLTRPDVDRALSHLTPLQEVLAGNSAASRANPRKK